MRQTPRASLCLLLLPSLALAVPVAAAPSEGPAVVEAGPQIGVTPFRVRGKIRGTRGRALEKDAQVHFQALLDAMMENRNDVVSLALPKEKRIQASTRKTMLRTVKKRARAAGVTQVLTGSMRGRGPSQVLEIELLAAEGRRLGAVTVRPQSLDTAWTAEVQSVLADLLIAPRAVAAPVVVEEAPAAVPAAPRKLVAQQAAIAESAPTSGGWMWTASSLSLGVLGAAALGGGAYFGAEAWGESETLVELPKGDATRTALEESSVQKALIADTLLVSGAALAGAAVVTGIVALLGAPMEEAPVASSVAMNR